MIFNKVQFLGILLALSLHFTLAPAFAQNNPIEQQEKEVRKHYDHIMEEYDKKEKDVEAWVKKNADTFLKKKYKIENYQYEGAKEHPWLPDGYPKEWKKIYKEDSKQFDISNLESSWSCFEPQLIGYAKCNEPPVTVDPLLTSACWQHCCLEEYVWYRFGLPDIPWGSDWYPDEYYEVIQFWYPENQAAINNYGRMRLNPDGQGITGSKKQDFKRKKLLSDKKKPEKQNNPSIAGEADETYPLKEDNKIKNAPQPYRQSPFKGHSFAQDSASKSVDHFAGHLYRTHMSVQLGNARVEGTPAKHSGWQKEKKSIFAALALQTSKKKHLNIWSEWDYFAVLSTIDSLSFQINDNRFKKAMKALFEKRGDQYNRGLKKNPYWKDKGEIAYRVGKWPKKHKPLTDVADIEADNNDMLKEFVYQGGLTLLPFSLTYQGYAQPELSLRLISARKMFEIGGNKELSKKFPDKEKGRMNTYTISRKDKAREIDKFQLIYPMRPDGKTAECMRSQKIPDMVQQSKDEWTHKNLKHDLMGYVDEDKSDSAIVHWNKRVACTCKLDSNWVLLGLGPYGSQEINRLSALGTDAGAKESGRGTGDRLYGIFEKVLCTYKEGFLPSAWAGKKTTTCDKGTGQSKKYDGLDDNV